MINYSIGEDMQDVKQILQAGQIWLLECEPTYEEAEYLSQHGHKQLGYALPCPACDSSHTLFRRQVWWVCLDCFITFTVEDANESQEEYNYNG